MSHPFTKIFYKALSKSTREDNLVLKEAEKIRSRGYRPEEIQTVLEKLQRGLIDDNESEIVREALEEFEAWIDN